MGNTQNHEAKRGDIELSDMLKNGEAQIGHVYFTDKGWRKLVAKHPMKFANEVISLPKPKEFCNG